MAREALTERHDGLYESRELWRRTKVVLVCVRRDDKRRERVALGQLIGRNRVLRIDHIAVLRQLLFTQHDLKPESMSELDRRTGLDAEDRHAVAETLQLLGDCERVALRASQTEVVRADDELHSGDPRAVSEAPRAPGACRGTARDRRAECRGTCVTAVVGRRAEPRG